MRNIQFIIIFLIVIGCDPKTQTTSQEEIQNFETSTTESIDDNVVSSAIIKSFERQIWRTNREYQQNVRSLNELRSMMKHISILNDSLKKINHGQGITPQRLLDIRSLIYKDETKGEIQDSINNGTLTDEELKLVLPDFIRIAALSEDFASFISFDSIYISSFQQYEELGFRDNVDRYKSIIRKYDSLHQANLDSDELLYYIGNLFFSEFNIGWNEGEVGYNKAIAFSYFDSLLKTYPSSEFADNAELSKLTYIEGMSHEGGDNMYNLKAIDKYQNFLSKYPKTESKEWINAQIAYLYSTAEIYYNKNARLEAILNGLKQVELMEDSFPDYRPERMAQIRKELNDQLTRFGWSLNISSDTTTYELGEPIILYYRLTNDTDSVKKIWLKPKDPNFSTFVHQIDFTYITHSPGKAIEVILDPHETYTEVYDITSLAYYGRNFGQYQFNTPSKYKMNAYGVGFKSNEITLTVISKSP